MDEQSRPQWRLPKGVTRGLWQYAHHPPIADDYDEYFAHHKLFDFDEAVLAEFLPAPAPGERVVVADLGCGTGRALVPLVRRGFAGLAIDLSLPMLYIVQEKADIDDLAIDCLHANLAELDCLCDGSIDHAICLFSTLGMIRGRDHRQAALAHVRRILKPGGRFVLHVHNFWYNLYDPGGPWWVLGNVLRATFVRDVERGDKYFTYRGVPNMFLHVFTRREITTALRQAGFRLLAALPLHPQRHRQLPLSWAFSNLRANGWIFVCE